MASEHVNSILLADIGSAHTRLALIDVVEGQYRFVAGTRARTTADAPLNSVSLGLDRAAQQITEATGRRLIGHEAENLFLMPEMNGHGIDEFLATSSAGRAMRVFLVGLTPELSLASAQRVLEGSYITVVDTISPYDPRTSEEQVNAILSARPDLILITGGTDEGVEGLLLDRVRTVRETLAVLRGQMPTVLFAGNRELRQRVKRLLSPYTSLFYAPNVRPDVQEEHIFPAQIELALAYDDFHSRQPGGFGDVTRRSKIGVVPTVQGAISAMRYLATLPPRRGIGTLYVDVGSANSALVAAVRGQARFGIHAGLGIGHSLVETLDTLDLDDVRKWLPPDVTPDELWDYAHNKTLRPATVPGTARDLMIEQAVARESVRFMFRQARAGWGLGRGDLLPDFRTVIAAGAVLTGAQHPGVSAMLLLDALQPVGMTELRLDPYALFSGLGVAGYLDPMITVQVLESDGLLPLATAFSPIGSVRNGQDAMRVQIQPASGRAITHTVKGGEIWMAPVSPGMACEVTLKLRRGLSIHRRRRIKLHLVAGAAGIIFDARGRPLSLPRPKARAARFAQWVAALTGQEIAAPEAPSADETEEAAHAVLS